MSNRDREAAFRMTLSGMRHALREVERLHNLYDCDALNACADNLHEAISRFTIARDAAAGEFGFIPRETMPT